MKIEECFEFSEILEELSSTVVDGTRRLMDWAVESKNTGGTLIVDAVHI